MTQPNTSSASAYEHGVSHNLVRGFASKWDGERRENHYAIRFDGVVFECTNIPHPHHLSNFGMAGKWAKSDKKPQDLKGIDFIGTYPIGMIG